MSIASRPTRGTALDIAENAPTPKVLVTDDAFALGPILQVTPVWHGDAERQRASTTGLIVRMKANRQLCPGDHPSASQRVGAAESLGRHLPDCARHVACAFQGEPLASRIERHEPQETNSHGLYAVL